MTMLDRLARALWDAGADSFNQWDALGEDERDTQRQIATAILHELLTPTEGMVAAAREASGSFSYAEDFHNKYAAAIQAAIEGG